MQQTPRERAHLTKAYRPLVARGNDAAHDVTVSAEVLRAAVQHEGRTQFERTLQDRRRECVVDENGHGTGIRDHLSDVGEFERGIRRALENHEAGVVTNRLGDGCRVAPRDGGAEQPGREYVIRTPVQRTQRDDVRLSRGHGREKTGRESGHPRRERHRGLGALERGQRLLESSHPGLPQSLIHRSLAGQQIAPGRERLVGIPAGLDAREREGRREIDRRNMASALSETCHSGVHSTGFEVGIVAHHGSSRAESATLVNELCRFCDRCTTLMKGVRDSGRIDEVSGCNRPGPPAGALGERARNRF